MSSPSFSPVHTLSFVYSLLWVCFTNRTQKSKIVNEIAFSFEFIIRKIWSSTSQIREQMSVPDFYVVTVAFLALKKTGFSEIKIFSKIFFEKF